MAFLDTIKQTIGNNVYLRLEKEAEVEVSIAMQMPLQDKWKQQVYHQPRPLLGALLHEHWIFENKGLKISPLELIDVLFKCKMLFAAQSRDEYMQRIGGGTRNCGLWQDRSRGNINAIINNHIDLLGESVKERTLLTQVNSFKGLDGTQTHGKKPQTFLDGLFTTLNLPFVAYLDEEGLLEKHKHREPRLRNYAPQDAKSFFYWPSIGFTCSGSERYCFLYARAWLRTFCNILRIAGFINPGQIDFGDNGIKFLAPKASVFLGDYAEGSCCWEEDTKEPWAKTPDGSLFLSFGYRGLSEMWLDARTYGGIAKVFLDNKRIFDHLRNPWSESALRDIIPTVDILSAAVQVPDVGAKILLLYCCLEHLFVPERVRSDNKKYIVGGMNAIRPDLLPWFDSLYTLRCAYAHKGFIARDDHVRGLMWESTRNVMALLVAKLANIAA